MIKLKYVPFFMIFLMIIVITASRDFSAFSSAIRDLPLIAFLGFLLTLIFSIPVYFFFKYKTFRLHTKTNLYFFNSSKESTFLFLFMYYLVYSIVIFSLSLIIVIELNAKFGFSFSTLILATSLIYIISSTSFFLIMHRLAAKSDTNKIKKSEGVL